MKNVEKLCLDCDNWIKELVQLKQVWYSVNCELSWYVYACENHFAAFEKMPSESGRWSE